MDLKLEQPLTPNDDGSYSLDLEPNLHIILRENSDSGMTLFTAIAPVPAKKREEFLVRTMVANLFGRETGGCALGLDKEGKKVTLLTFLPEALTYHDFYDFLEDFVNYADAWQREVLEFASETG